MLKKILIATFVTLSATFADETIQFPMETVNLGDIPQGESRHVKLAGANLSNGTVDIETVMCQGIGCSNFKYTKTAKPREPINVEFDYSTATLEGQIANLVVIVDKNGKPHTVTLEGNVIAPFIFSEKMFDAGYYTAGEKREWTFYVWNNDKKTRPDLTLPQSDEFTAEIKSVKLNVEKFDAVKKGGKTPGVKVTLRTKGLVRDAQSKQKSLSKIVSFKSQKYPQSTPEVLIIGYWK